MHYFKLLLIFVWLLMLTSPPVLAENWVEVVGADNEVYIDSDSILSDGNYLFYNIKYYEPKAREDLIVTVQARENSAGIVKTCPVSKYNKDKTINTDIIAKHFKEITPESKLYNANEFAKSYKYGSSSAGRSADVGSARPSMDAIKEPDFGPYMRELQRRIKINWDPPKGNESKRVVLLFKIAKDGRLLSCSVFKSSGLQKADSAALNAVNLAAPFRPLPHEYKESSIDVQFTFDYNVFGASKY